MSTIQKPSFVACLMYSTTFLTISPTSYNKKPKNLNNFRESLKYSHEKR